MTTIFEKHMQKKNIFTMVWKQVGGLLVAAVFVLGIPVVSGDMGLTASVAEASTYGLTYDREVREGRRTMEKYKKEYGAVPLAQDDPIIKIQENIVKSNPDKLSFTDHRKRRWVMPAYMTTRGKPDWGGESVGGPYIILNHNTMVFLGKNKIKDSEQIIYTSQVATVIAHECGHIIHHDTRLQRLIELPFSRSSVSTEARADDAGMDLINNVPEYSIGSFMWIRNGVEDKKHPSDEEAVRQVIKKIKDLSGGRVILGTDGSLTVDGTLLLGTGYLPYGMDAPARERTEYLAGQIASCIQKGIWKKSHLAFMKERSYFQNGRYGWTLLVAYSSSDHTGKPVKILGSFQTNMDEKAGKNYSDEEKDALLTVYRLAD